MSQRFRFFDSIEGEDEREYTADEFAEYFRQFISNGIFNGGENLQVAADGNDMKVYIKEGYAWIEGYLYKIDTEPLILELSTAHPSLNRIDRIVLRLDKSLEKRYVKAFILEGTPAEAPLLPELTRDSNVYEIALAQIEIIGGKSFIEAYQITDERLNGEVCGLVNSLITTDTTEIFNQFQAWLDSKIKAPNGEFYKEWKTWLETVQDTTNLLTKTEFNDYQAEYESFKGSTEVIFIEIEKKLANYDSYASDKDENGVFTILDYMRGDSTLYMKSALTNPDINGNYQTMTWEFYNDAGTSVIDTKIWTITYDEEGSVVSRVVAV